MGENELKKRFYENSVYYAIIVEVLFFDRLFFLFFLTHVQISMLELWIKTQ